MSIIPTACRMSAKLQNIFIGSFLINFTPFFLTVSSKKSPLYAEPVSG
jgi:hypothetical protein